MVWPPVTIFERLYVNWECGAHRRLCSIQRDRRQRQQEKRVMVALGCKYLEMIDILLGLCGGRCTLKAIYNEGKMFQCQRNYFR